MFQLVESTLRTWVNYHILRWSLENEYTTKVNALGEKLLEGLRRASEKILREEANQTPHGPVSKDVEKQKERERIKAVLKKLVYLMNSLQVKSGSELIFPMLINA